VGAAFQPRRSRLKASPTKLSCWLINPSRRRGVPLSSDPAPCRVRRRTSCCEIGSRSQGRLEGAEIRVKSTTQQSPHYPPALSSGTLRKYGSHAPWKEKAQAAIPISAHNFIECSRPISISSNGLFGFTGEGGLATTLSARPESIL
jgi:hypothetical protein